LPECGGDGALAEGIDKEGSVTRDLGHAAAVGGDDGAVERHGFEDGKAESLFQRREDRGDGVAIKSRERVLRDFAGENDILIESAELAGEVATADECEGEIRNKLFYLFEGLNESAVVLEGVEAGNI
jgi:hypothetical protein